MSQSIIICEAGEDVVIVAQEMYPNHQVIVSGLGEPVSPQVLQKCSGIIVRYHDNEKEVYAIPFRVSQNISQEILKGRF